MARWLKQSTSVDVPIGPFVDATDGVTAESGLTITQPDIRLKKNGGAWAQKNAAQTLSHEENGYYEVTLDTTDTNTLGLLRLAVAESGALPIWEDFLVVPANVWDSLFSTDLLQVDTREVGGTTQTARDIGASVLLSSGTGTGQISLTSGIASVNTTQLAGSSTAATNLSGSATGILLGTVDTAGAAATTSMFETSSTSEATADHFVGRIVIFRSGVLLYQQALVTAYALNGGRGRFTVTTMTDAPSNGDTFAIL